MLIIQNVQVSSIEADKQCKLCDSNMEFDEIYKNAQKTVR
jgi:hypothetical protein